MKKVQKVKETYFPTKNYIGCTEKQHKLTNHIAKKHPLINYVSFWHDIDYGYRLHKAESIINKIFLKLLFDLVFLMKGTVGSLIKLDFKGAIITMSLYLILLIHTPVYIVKYLK